MLGKTNITAIEAGTIVSGIENYSWEKVKVEGVTGMFVKAIYENDTLVVITKDGTIAYTVDGENWSTIRLDIEGTYELNDIIWDGRRYIAVGSREEIVEQEYIYHGFIAVTENLADFTVIHADNDYSRYFAVVEKNGKYIVISKEFSQSDEGAYICTNTGDIENWGSCYKSIICVLQYEVRTSVGGSTSVSYKYAEKTADCKVMMVKNFHGGILCVEFARRWASNSIWEYIVLVTSGWNDFGAISVGTPGKIEDCKILTGFECRGNVYFINSNKQGNLVKVDTNTSETYRTDSSVCYVDAIYYDKSDVFLSEFGMMIVRKGEHVSEKVPEDLIEITYDFSMKLIVKAFTGLYILGSGGNILKSSNEVKNEEALAVRTMSATKALYDAKAYTNEKYKMLEERIAVLEMAGAGL